MHFSSKITAGILALSLLAGSALADTFSFSYLIPDGTNRSVSGILTGNQLGDSLTGYVTDVTVDSVSFDGVAFVGPLENASRDGSQPFAPYGPLGSAVVSFALQQNNFIFVDRYLENGMTDFTNVFFITPTFEYVGYQVAGGLEVGTPSDEILVGQDDEAKGTWTLTNLTHPVPDTGTTIALLGLAFIGLAGVRRATQS